MKYTDWEFAGTVGVDSGHVTLMDMCYADDFREKWIEKTISTPGGYDKTVKNDVAQLKLGFAGAVTCAAGMGDGIYRVFVQRGYIAGFGSGITRMMIDFTEQADFNE